MTRGKIMNEQKKNCFVITPIGNDNSSIRRHIDGIIDQAIIPALEEKYEIEVAHRKYEIGSINDRVIKSIFNSDLVIANLTELNPNVMFELAIRYSFGKPAIVIAEKNTKLPFDIIDENTIFYINDPAGANDLKNSIKDFEANIDLEKQLYGPVYKAINTIPLYKAVESGEEISNNKMFSYIIERLDIIENRVNSSCAKNQIKNNIYNEINFKFDINNIKENEIEIVKEIREMCDSPISSISIGTNYIDILFGEKVSRDNILLFAEIISDYLKKQGVENIRWRIRRQPI